MDYKLSFTYEIQGDVDFEDLNQIDQEKVLAEGIRDFENHLSRELPIFYLNDYEFDIKNQKIYIYIYTETELSNDTLDELVFGDKGYWETTSRQTIYYGEVIDNDYYEMPYEDSYEATLSLIISDAKVEELEKSLNEVYPNKGESKSDFINRFMRVTAKEYPDVKQRYAVAYSYWDRRNKNEGLLNKPEKVHGESPLDEDYLDPEEEFWDYRTGEIESEDIFDETRSESGYGQSYIDNLNKEYKGKISHIEYLTPREYFEKCAEGFNSSFENQIRQIRADKENLEHLKEVITKYNKKFPITYLDYSKNDFRQEGRHRMYVAGELIDWDKKFPVLVIKDADKVLNLNIRRNRPSVSHRLERYVLEDETRGAILYGNSAYDMLINLQNIEDSLDKDTFNALWDFIYDHKESFK